MISGQSAPLKKVNFFITFSCEQQELVPSEGRSDPHVVEGSTSGFYLPDMNLKIGFGAAIRQERSVLGISQGELAKRSGLHRTYVSDLERGARNPSIENIEKLAQALQVSVVKLFEQPGAEEATKSLVDGENR